VVIQAITQLINLYGNPTQALDILQKATQDNCRPFDRQFSIYIMEKYHSYHNF